MYNSRKQRESRVRCNRDFPTSRFYFTILQEQCKTTNCSLVARDQLTFSLLSSSHAFCSLLLVKRATNNECITYGSFFLTNLAYLLHRETTLYNHNFSCHLYISYIKSHISCALIPSRRIKVQCNNCS